MVFEKITLNDILTFLVFLVGLITAIEFLYVRINKLFDKKLDPISKELIDIRLNSNKNFIVRFLADIEQGNPVDETEKERFHEAYDEYTHDGGNSYIKHKVEKLEKEGKL